MTHESAEEVANPRHLGWWQRPASTKPNQPPAPRWAVAVVFLGLLPVYGTFYWLLPRLGVHWFYDYYKVGGFLPMFAYSLLTALWLDRKWPTDNDEQ